MLKSVKLTITNCLECPHHGTERDPSSDDSFDWQDESLVCYLSKTETRSSSELGGYGWSKPGRVICGFSRNAESEYKREKMGIPDWCPLKKKAIPKAASPGPRQPEVQQSATKGDGKARRARSASGTDRKAPRRRLRGA